MAVWKTEDRQERSGSVAKKTGAGGKVFLESVLFSNPRWRETVVKPPPNRLEHPPFAVPGNPERHQLMGAGAGAQMRWEQRRGQ